MDKTPASITSNVINLNSWSKSRVSEKDNFNSLLESADSKLSASSLVSDFLNKIGNSLNDASIFFQNSVPATFPFSPSFTSTFGTSGPLPAYINLMTAKLHLTASQNQAFQDIAIRNKDITNTPANVHKIAAELKEAGIKYS